MLRWAPKSDWRGSLEVGIFTVIQTFWMSPTSFLVEISTRSADVHRIGGHEELRRRVAEGRFFFRPEEELNGGEGKQLGLFAVEKLFLVGKKKVFLARTKFSFEFQEAQRMVFNPPDVLDVLDVFLLRRC